GGGRRRRHRLVIVVRRGRRGVDEPCQTAQGGGRLDDDLLECRVVDRLVGRGHDHRLGQRILETEPLFEAIVAADRLRVVQEVRVGRQRVAETGRGRNDGQHEDDEPDTDDRPGPPGAEARQTGGRHYRHRSPFRSPTLLRCNATRWRTRYSTAPDNPTSRLSTSPRKWVTR